MTPNRHRFNPFEWLIVAAVIGVIMAVGMAYYNSLAERAVGLNMELSARNFASAAQVVRAYSHLLPEGERRVIMDGGDPRRWLEAEPLTADKIVTDDIVVWVNASGWPVDAGSGSGEAVDGVVLTAAACERVWRALLKVENSAKVGDIYWEALTITQSGANRCRYSLQRSGAKEYAFEYSSATGRTVYRGE